MWISGHKLLVFRGFTLQSSQLFTKCVSSLYYVFYFFILDFQLLSLFDHVNCDNKRLTYLLTYFTECKSHYHYYWIDVIASLAADHVADDVVASLTVSHVTAVIRTLHSLPVMLLE